MDADFWNERWEKGETGWHEGRPNPYLVQHWERLALPPGSTVLVPLCGKSVDLLWLRERGAHAVGVELSGIAVRDFAEESGLTLNARRDGALTRHFTGGLELWEGDIFDLSPGQLPAIDAVFDRAALMALPSRMRGPYARQLQRLAPAARAMLIVTTYSPQASDERPPFSVDADEIRAHFGETYRVEVLETKDILADFPALQRRGFRSLTETAYQLVRRDESKPTG
ncbi:thiopurine S-methyltransferase [Ectothiorhodospiraceae bacterium WFHF3C12]|nr:thiopurine S-methyltransferase [Ectothiorhodospiraceae bacterium WFHF3C12]